MNRNIAKRGEAILQQGKKSKATVWLWLWRIQLGCSGGASSDAQPEEVKDLEW